MPTLSGVSVLESTLNRTLACGVSNIQLIGKVICESKLTVIERTLRHCHFCVHFVVAISLLKFTLNFAVFNDI